MTPALHQIKFAIFFLLAYLFASTAQATDTPSSGTVTLQLKGAHSFEFAGYYAAIEQGYYREAGITVNLKEAQTDTDPATEVDNGMAEYATGGSSLILDYKAGKNVVLLAVIMQHSPYMLLARQTQTLHDLADKNILLETQARELLAYLKSEEFPLEKLHAIERAAEPQDLINGNVSAIAGSLIYHTYYLDRANFTYQIYSPRAVGMDFYGDNLFTSEQELKKYPQRVQAFLAASLRGWQYAMNHPDEITGLIVSKYSQRHPRQFFLYQAKQMQTLMRPDLIPIGQMNTGRWQHIAETYASIGLMPEHYNFEGFFYNQPRQLSRNKLLWIITGIVLLISSIIVGYYISRIKRRLARSISETKLVEQQEISHSRILELLGKDAPLSDILDLIVTTAEQSITGAKCSISILDGTSSKLLIGSAPSLPDFFKKEMHGLEIGVGVAACGTAAFTGQRVIVDDINTHPYWASFKAIALRAQLKSAWSEPILTASGKTLGTFAIYHTTPCSPLERDLQFMHKTATLTAIALERSRAEQSIRENEKLLSDILENVSASIYMKDRRGRYLFANRVLQEIFNAPRNEIIGFDDSKFYDAGTAANISNSDLKVLKSGERLRMEEVIPNPLTAQTRIYLTTRIPLRHEEGEIYAICCIATDITEQKEAEEKMRKMAQYDALTKLPNRALFNDRLQQAFTISRRSHQHFGLMYIDLDKFKPVNDTYGHEAGDLLLKEAAVRMQSCIRQSDTVARIGGDEFVVLLTSIKDEKDAFEIGEKIRHSLNLPFAILGKTLNIGSSIGVAIYPQHGNDEKALVKNADVAMYYAKENGRNNVTIYHAGLQKTH